VTIIPADSADGASSHSAGDQLPGSAALAFPVLTGPRRGYRARPAAEIADLIKDLAQQIAKKTGAALSAPDTAEGGEHAAHPEVITLIATPVASWYPVLAAALAESVPKSHVPVRGVTDIITAAAAVPPALDAMGAMTRGFARRVHGLSPSGRSPLIAEAELGGLWLNAVVAALREPGLPRRYIRVTGLGLPQADPVDSCYLLCAAVPTTLMWRPRRWLRKKNQNTALAQWMLISAAGNVIAGGVTASSPLG
jgi:hypothetical protein